MNVNNPDTDYYVASPEVAQTIDDVIEGDYENSYEDAGITHIFVSLLPLFSIKNIHSGSIYTCI